MFLFGMLLSFPVTDSFVTLAERVREVFLFMKTGGERLGEAFP